MAYVIEYYHQYYDIAGTLHKIELLSENSYSGGGTAIEKSAGESSVRLRHYGVRERFEETIIQGQELIFSFYIHRDDVAMFDLVFESDYRDYKVKYYIDEQLKFEGYLKPENLSRDYFTTPPYVNVLLSATDALADLREIEFRDSNDRIINAKMPILEAVKYAVARTGIELDFIIQLGTYEATYMASNECALKKTQIDTRRFIKEDTPMSCWDVIESVLKSYSVVFKQCNGYYQITNHHELNSYQFVFDYETLTQQSRTVTDNIIDVANYKFAIEGQLQKIRPLKSVGILFKNRDLGGDVTGIDLSDWDNNWTINFFDYDTLGGIGIVRLESNSGAADDYITLKEDFFVTKVTDNDYLKLSFDHRLYEVTGEGTPTILLEIKVWGPGEFWSTSINIYGSNTDWFHFESKLYPCFKIYDTGDYNVKISFINDSYNSDWNWDTAKFEIKDVKISKIVNALEDYDKSSVVYDRYFRQESNKGFEAFETGTIFADTLQATEAGALLYDNSGAWANTGAWNSYGGAEEIKLLDIYARNILNNRYNYKNCLRLTIHDRPNAITFNNILEIQDRNYVFISYERDCRLCIVEAELIEILTIQQNYGTIVETVLDSVDGERTSTHNVTPSSSSVPAHNYLSGLYGSSPYYHLDLTKYTNVGNLASMAYQATASYYTKTEIDTWRAEVTQTEMSYLHGVTSSVQTQITARAVISGTPADNQIAVWTGATAIEGSNSLVFTATGLGVKTVTPNYGITLGDGTGASAYFQIFTTNVGTGGILFSDESTTNPGAIFYDHNTNNMYFRVAAIEVARILSSGRFGINRNDPSYLFDVNGIGRFVGDLYGDANIQHLSFSSGWQGTNWQITLGGNAEFNNLFVRGGMAVNELIINTLRYQNGGLIIGAGGGKIATINSATQGSERLYFQDPKGDGVTPFTVGAIVMVQRFDLNRTAMIKKIVRQVSAVQADGRTDLTSTAGWVPAVNDTGVFAIGDDVVAIGHVSNVDLDSNLYMSAVDSNNPFLRMYDGVNSYAKFSLSDKTSVKVQLGNLESLAEYDIVPISPGFGLYSDNVFLKGTIVAESGEIGGWTLDSDAIYTGDKSTVGGYNEESGGGVTFAADGSIHAPNWYIDVDGDIGVRQIEEAVFKVDADNWGIKIQGGHIWENERAADDGFVGINIDGYQKGNVYFRNFGVGDGKGTQLFGINGEEDYVFLGYDLDTKIRMQGTVFNDDPGYYAAEFFNDGNNAICYGIKIQCGEDALSVNDNYPIRFYDGNGDYVGGVYFNNSTLTFAYVSDILLKENIRDYVIDSDKIIKNLQLREFNWKSDPTETKVVGFIADEVEKIYPEMVLFDKDTKLKCLDMSKLIPLMILTLQNILNKK